MPAARPSQASIGNTIKAIVACGLTPGAIHVGSDGTFRVEILDASQTSTLSNSRPAANECALSWEDVA